jgi:hypothetical protein
MFTALRSEIRKGKYYFGNPWINDRINIKHLLKIVIYQY